MRRALSSRQSRGVRSIRATSSALFDRLLKSAGLPHYRIHDLHHFYASGPLAHGVEPKVISDILGNKDIGITARGYTHTSESRHTRRYGPIRLDGRYEVETWTFGPTLALVWL